MEAATGDMKLASPNGAVKKIFRARKTMTASCRQQIATINKLKKTSKTETFDKESPVLPKENVQQKQTELVLVANCSAQNNASPEKELHLSQNFSSNGFKPSAEASPDHKNSCADGMWKEWSKTCENSASRVPTPVGNAANVSHMAHDVNDANSSTDMMEVNDVCSASSHSGAVQSENLRSDHDPFQDIGKDTLSNIDICSPVSENKNESASLRTINEDSFLKMNSAIGLLTPLDIVDTDSTNAAIPSNESNASCDTTGTSNSVLPKFTVNLHVDSDPGNLSQDCNITIGDCQKKRFFSGDADVPKTKRAKTSNKSLLDEIENVIQRRVRTVIKESFDQKIQDLSKQINLIQCKQDNTAILTKHIRSIRRLGRHLKYALKVQNEVGTQSSKVPSVGSTFKELPKTDAAAKSFTNVPAEQASTSHTENSSVQNLSEDCSNLVVLSDNETEQQSDQGQTERLKNASVKVDHSALRKIMESIKEHRNKTLSSRMEKPAAVIDLTDDEEQKANGDATYLSRATSSSPASIPEVLKEENLSQKCSEKREVLSENNKNERSYDVTEKASSDQKSGEEFVGPAGENSKGSNAHSLQEVSSSLNLWQDKQKTVDSVANLEICPNLNHRMLKPPQKPELRLAQVQNPKGIALSWNITNADPSCAPPEFYCLYVHQENPNNSKKLWKKIGEIKALPLPMACTLTQFVDDATYSFVLRAKDACGRFGPLCDVQSTTLKSLNTPKKT